jgi:hypothetical protein
LKHIISFLHTDLRNSPSANFLIIPFEIFQEHTLRALFTKSIMSDDKNLYMCAIYITPDKNVFYRKYECDIFDELQEEIELYSVDGNVAVIGDLNGRVGKEPDFLRHDNLNRQLNDNIANFIEYVPDDIFCDRLTEDLKHPNIFGNRILQLCRSSRLRICNGRFGESSGKFTFQNKNGCSVIDYMLLSCESFSIVHNFTVGKFTTFSCHAPLFVDIKLKGLSIPSECTCKKIKCKTVRWNEEFKDEVKSDLMVNAHKFEELFHNITEDGETTVKFCTIENDSQDNNI